MSSQQSARFNMIEQQVRPWEVIDFKVLHTMEQIDRIDFVDEKYQGLAYADCQIPVTDGVRMLPPTIEGRLLQALQIEPTDRVLEIGCSTGYLTACLANLAQHVVTLHTSTEILDLAKSNLASYPLDNVEFRVASTASINDIKLFDVIAVSASLADIPENLKQAMAINGRLFAVCGEAPIMEATLLTRTSETDWESESLFETSLPRLTC